MILYMYSTVLCTYVTALYRPTHIMPCPIYTVTHTLIIPCQYRASRTGKHPLEIGRYQCKDQLKLYEIIAVYKGTIIDIIVEPQYLLNALVAVTSRVLLLSVVLI